MGHAYQGPALCPPLTNVFQHCIFLLLWYEHLSFAAPVVQWALACSITVPWVPVAFISGLHFLQWPSQWIMRGSAVFWKRSLDESTRPERTICPVGSVQSLRRDSRDRTQTSLDSRLVQESRHPSVGTTYYGAALVRCLLAIPSNLPSA